MLAAPEQDEQATVSLERGPSATSEDTQSNQSSSFSAEPETPSTANNALNASASVDNKPKTVLNPLAAAFQFGLDPDAPQITPFYSSSAIEEGASDDTPVFSMANLTSDVHSSLHDAHSRTSSDAADKEISRLGSGGMLGFSPLSSADEVYVPATRGLRTQPQRAPISQQKPSASSLQDIDVSPPGSSSSRAGSISQFDSMQPSYGSGNLPQSRASYYPEQGAYDAAPSSASSQTRSELGAYGRSFSERNLGGDDWNDPLMDHGSYASSRSMAGTGSAWDRRPAPVPRPAPLPGRMGMGMGVRPAALLPPKTGYGSAGYGDDLGPRYPGGPVGTSMRRPPIDEDAALIAQFARDEPYGVRPSQRRTPVDEYFDSASSRRLAATAGAPSMLPRQRSMEEELILRQMELQEMQARQGMHRRPRHPPEPPPPPFSNELAAYLQGTGRAQNKGWMEAHGGDPSVVDVRRPRIREDIAAGRFRTDLGPPGYPSSGGYLGVPVGPQGSLPPRLRGDSPPPSFSSLTQHGKGISASSPNLGGMTGRITPNPPPSTSAMEEQLILQHLSQLPPQQRQAALMRLAQQQRQGVVSSVGGLDANELAGRFGSMSFSSGSGSSPDFFGQGLQLSTTATPISADSEATKLESPDGQAAAGRSTSPSIKSNVPSSPSATVRGDSSPPAQSSVVGVNHQPSRAKRANLDTLPHPVLLRILNYLKPGRLPFSDLDPPSPSPTRDLHSLLRVCRRLHFATVPVLWSRLILRTDQHARSCIASVARRVQWQGPGGSLAIWTRSIEVWGAVAAEVVAALRVIVMEAMREANGGIRELSLSCAPGMDEYILFRMFENTEPAKLETLRLRGAGVTDRMCGIITVWCRHLQTLEIISGNVSDQGIVQLLQNPHVIKSLQLRRCVRLTDISLQAIAMNARKIETLVLDLSLPPNVPQSRVGIPSSITDRGFAELARTCRNLRRVELVDCDISDTGMDALVITGRDLEILEISTTDNAMKGLAAFASSNPGSLDIASLAATLPIRQLSDRSFQNAFRSLQLLRRFRLSSRHLGYGIPGTSLAWLLQTCPRLQALDLSRTRVADSALVNAFSTSVGWGSGLLAGPMEREHDPNSPLSFPSLSVILLQECSEVGAASILEIAKTCPSLAVVSLARDPAPAPHGAPTIDDEAVQALVMSRGRNLRVLDLACTDVGPMTLMAVAENCPRLEVLNLVGCRGITVAGGLVENIIMRCKKLRIIGFDRETEALLSIVAKHRAVGTRGDKAALRIARNRLIWEGWNFIEETSGYKVFVCDLD